MSDAKPKGDYQLQIAFVLEVGLMKLFLRLALFIGICTALAHNASAWDGTDSSTGSDVTIESGTLVREGEDIQVFDHGRGEYRDVTVGSINSFGSSVDVEVTDTSTGETTTFEMERRQALAGSRS